MRSSIRTALALSILLPASASLALAQSEPVHPLLVDAEWLVANHHRPDVVIVHVGRDTDAFRKGQLPDARLLPIRDILVERDGVPNLLPDPEALEATFRGLGIGSGDHVVLYGDMGGLAPARAFVTLDYLGHERVSLLDGGIDGWRAAGGRTLLGDAPSVAEGDFRARVRSERVVDATWVRERLGDPSVALIDARPADFYHGREQGSMARAGHIPGAGHRFWQEDLDENGRLLKDAELAARYAEAGASTDRTVVLYCGTGVQASHAYFVARHLGYGDVRIYDGSMAEWGALPHDEYPVVTGDGDGGDHR